jgi:hypothetical protein
MPLNALSVVVQIALSCANFPLQDVKEEHTK